MYVMDQKLSADYIKLKHEIWDPYIEKVSKQMVKSKEYQLRLWLERELDGEAFSTTLERDAEAFRQEFIQRGYIINVDGNGEYTLFQNGHKLSSFKPQVNFIVYKDKPHG